MEHKKVGFAIELANLVGDITYFYTNDGNISSSLVNNKIKHVDKMLEEYNYNNNTNYILCYCGLSSLFNIVNDKTCCENCSLFSDDDGV